MTQYAPSFAPDLSLTPVIRAALVSVVLLVGGLGGAAVLLPINGAVVAQGQLVVPGKPLPVQSLDAGIVASVAVQNGQSVAAGDVLLMLDPTVAQTQRDIAMDQLGAALAQAARLRAEDPVLAISEPDFTSPPLPFAPPDMTADATRQRALLAARQAQTLEARSQLAGTQAQLAAQIEGVVAELVALSDQKRLLDDDIARETTLLAKGLVRQASLNDLERQQATLTGRAASLGSERLRLEAAQAEARARLAEQEGLRAEEVATALHDAETQIKTLTSQIIALQGALTRTVLRAPVAGVVHELAVTAPGAVVAPGTTLVQIVPTMGTLEIEVAVEPRHIDRVRMGQPAKIMLAAFDPRAVPRLPAHVTNIPPGAVTDPNTGRSFYRVSLTLEQGALPTGLDLRPGMPVEAFLSTGERPLLSWLIAPLVDPMARALREP